jgi:hypothetical protein
MALLEHNVSLQVEEKCYVIIDSLSIVATKGSPCENLKARSRMHGAILPLPQYAFMAWWSVKGSTRTTII